MKLYKLYNLNIFYRNFFIYILQYFMKSPLYIIFFIHSVHFFFTHLFLYGDIWCAFLVLIFRTEMADNIVMEIVDWK